ncbi:hypothetical protein AXF42_Ash008839 [Apostasia shenzhenica]|uniref:Uncharacterized protein n=1 Tax=Apostasia shenzhenica TaxID=1088818 RepID=A0A2I0ASM8_9ASPA|nr:hypothetical protein AXF42_Ash008839 [Apostasia shenzhenica]
MFTTAQARPGSRRGRALSRGFRSATIITAATTTMATTLAEVTSHHFNAGDEGPIRHVSHEPGPGYAPPPPSSSHHRHRRDDGDDGEDALRTHRFTGGYEGPESFDPRPPGVHHASHESGNEPWRPTSDGPISHVLRSRIRIRSSSAVRRCDGRSTSIRR